MSEKRASKLLVAAFVWCVIIGVLAVAYKLMVAPYFDDRLEGKTGSESQYKHKVTVAADSFAGYGILRSDTMRDQLKAKGIRFECQDDGADYEKRIKALRNGDIQMAVFTVDSLLASGAKLGEYPGTIVLVLDETKGADALVAYKSAVASIQDLDSPDARIVATPNSPSEFLARVVLAHFSLPQLPEKWLVEADGARDAYKKLCSAKKDEKRAYALWQPYVSMAMQEEGVHVLLDSSKMSGLIVDVLVAQRKFLADHPDLVKEVIETYLRTAYSCDQRQNGLVDMVMEDAKKTGAERLSKEQAQTIVDGVQWKNTMENYAHFGLLPQNQSGGVQHMEDIIGNISEVLVKTGALPSNPVEGKESTLFYSQILKDLQASAFHPGKKMNVLEGVGLSDDDLDAVREEKELPALSDGQWDALVPVGEMSVRPISFGRGTARINVQSERDLKELAKRLKSLPQYYLIVVGHSRAEGDAEANMRLAQERADAAAQMIRVEGVSQNRIKVKTAKPAEQNGAAQSVSFLVGQVPY